MKLPRKCHKGGKYGAENIGGMRLSRMREVAAQIKG
jgi:hypothetical protein